jgi:ribonuclease VapC
VSDSPACVLDASALLAYLRDEPGGRRVEEALLGGAALSAVNLAEVLGKLADAGEDPAAALRRLEEGGLVPGAVEVVPFDAVDALETAALRLPTRGAGLSLGDRACLALARRLGLPALTTDGAWRTLRAGVRVEVVR